MKSSLILTLSAVALLAACSDGNGITEDQGNDNNGNGGGGAGGDASITAANAVVVTRITYESALAAGIATEYSGVTGLIAVQTNPVLKFDGSFGTANAPSSSSGKVPIPPTVENCLVSGTSTLSGDIADPLTPTFTPEDFFDIVFANCDDGFSVIDGALLYVVDAFSGELAGLYDLTMTATFTDFQVAAAGETLLTNGDVTVRLNSLQSPLISAETSGNSLTVDSNEYSQTMTNFAGSYSQDVEAVPSPFSQSSSGTLDSTQLPGVVTYSTPVTFTGFDGEYPSAGEFLVTGESSGVRLVAVDNTNIRIEVDTNGDGTVDETINSTWVELEGG